MKKLNLKKAFTLIELLIVIGILAILVVTVLVSLNPGEAQKKSRDTKRMRDLATIQAAIEQYIGSGGAMPASVVAPSTTFDTAASTSVACDGTGWLPLNICKYLSKLPLDPSNNVTRTVVTNNPAGCATGVLDTPTIYRVALTPGGSYEVNVLQESRQNCRNTANDGGNATNWVEVGSNMTLIAN